MEIPRRYKIIFVGDTNTGKTSLIARHINGQSEINIPNTVGIEFSQSTITAKGVPVSLNIWDTAGQERYISITRNYFRGSQGVFIVFDMSLEKNNLEKWLIELSNELNGREIPKVVIGNKLDKLSDDDALRIKKEFEKKGEQKNFKFFMCSAVDGRNVNEAFLFMAEELLKEEKNLEKKNFEGFRKRKCC